MFDRCAVPTPFRGRDVNVYLAGRTLVDPGPVSEAAIDELDAFLAAHDLTPGDVRRVVVTHPHVDHFGQARRFADEGATVLASPEAGAIVPTYEARLEIEESYIDRFCQRCGMDSRTARIVAGLRSQYFEYGEDVAVDRELVGGDRLTVDGTDLTVLELAGHAPGEIGLGFEEADGSRCALVGDNVLATSVPVPFLSPPLDSADERPRVLPAYLDSLERLREGNFDRLYPGHHDPVERPAERIAAIEETLSRQVARVRRTLDEPATPVELLHTVFSNLSPVQQALGICKIVGYLDVLERRNEVRIVDRDDRIVYERVAE